MMEITLGSTLILPALGIVELNVICLAFYVEENISTLVIGYCKSNHRGFVGINT